MGTRVRLITKTMIPSLYSGGVDTTSSASHPARSLYASRARSEGGAGGAPESPAHECELLGPRTPLENPAPPLPHPGALVLPSVSLHLAPGAFPETSVTGTGTTIATATPFPQPNHALLLWEGPLRAQRSPPRCLYRRATPVRVRAGGNQGTSLQIPPLPRSSPSESRHSRASPPPRTVGSVPRAFAPSLSLRLLFAEHHSLAVFVYCCPRILAAYHSADDSLQIEASPHCCPELLSLRRPRGTHLQRVLRRVLAGRAVLTSRGFVPADTK